MKASEEKPNPQVLEGVTIVDLTYLVPGGYCTRLLANYGARVVRVERPGDLFDLTDVWPWGDDSASLARRAMAARYFQINCNKESLTLDYTSQKGKKLLMKLIRRSDVLVEGYRPGIMEGYGLGYLQVKEVNPDLIYCSISGYGQNGPYAKLPTHDPNIQALGGIMGLSQGPNGPQLPGVPVGDITAGSNAAMAILLALIARERGIAGGQHLDISMLDSAVWATGICRADAYFATGQYLHTGSRPLHIYKTLDGKYICLVVLEEKFWQTLCVRLGLEEYAGDRESVLPFSEDSAYRREIIARLRAIFRTRTREGWFKLLSDCCLTPVLDLDEVLEDTNTKDHHLVTWLNDSKLGIIPYLGVPFRMSKTPGEIRRPAPLKGEHTARVLSELGCSEDEKA